MSTRLKYDPTLAEPGNFSFHLGPNTCKHSKEFYEKISQVALHQNLMDEIGGRFLDKHLASNFFFTNDTHVVGVKFFQAVLKIQDCLRNSAILSGGV